MGFSCAICSEGLDNRPATNPGEVVPQLGNGAAKVSSTPCGHVFHTFCITKWMAGGMQSSNACPCCRKPIPRKMCLPLYPDSYDDSVLESTAPDLDVDVLAMARVKQSYEEELRKLRSELRKQKGELDTQVRLYELQCEEFHKVQSKLVVECNRSETFVVKWKKYEAYKDAYKVLKPKYDVLERDIEKYNYIQAHLQNVEFDTEQDIKSLEKQSRQEALKTLSSLKNILHKEVLNMSEKRADDRSNTERLIKQVTNLQRELSQLQNDYVELEDVKEKLRAENQSLRKKVKESRSDTPSPKAGSSLSTDCSRSKKSPSKKRRADEPGPHIFGNTIIIDDDDEDDNVDNDVGLLSLTRNTFKKPKSVSSKSGQSRQKTSKESGSASTGRGSESSSDDSVMILTPPSTSDDEAVSSGVEMRTRTNIPGVPPITPLLPRSKKFTFKKNPANQFKITH